MALVLIPASRKGASGTRAGVASGCEDALYVQPSGCMTVRDMEYEADERTMVGRLAVPDGALPGRDRPC